MASEHDLRTREDLLAEIARRIEDLEGLPTLDGPAYMRGHVAFEGSSDQQGQILAWLVDRLASDPLPALDVVSVGAGSGILDVPILETVGRTKTLRYTVVEPFAEQCEKFAQRAEHLERGSGLELTIHQAELEHAELGGDFDVVLAIHSIYYVRDLDRSLEQLHGLTRPGGELVLAVAPREDMNRLADLFWRPQHHGTVWFEEDVVAALDRLGIGHAIERLDAHLDVAPDDPAWIDVASFLVQSPLQELPKDFERLALAYLRAAGESSGGLLTVPHPVSMIRVPGRARR